MKKHKVVLYNPKSVFYTMPLALVAVASYLDPEKFEKVHAPVGLEIGALTPYEIAISIAAELIAVRRGATGLTHKAVDRAHPASATLAR